VFEISEVANPATRYGKLSAALPRITNGALALAVAPMIYLHLVSIGRLDPLHTTVSDYVSVPGGTVLLAISTVALAVTAVSLPAQLATAGRPVPATARISLALGCVGLLASVVFPTNVLGTVADESTVLHRYAAGLFFVAVPIAAWSLARAAVRAGSPTPATGRLAVVSVLVGTAFLLSHLPLVFPAFPRADLIATVLPRGLVERVLLVVDSCALAVIARSANRTGLVRPARPAHLLQPTQPARPAQPAQPTRMVRR
jgi:hypothetical protein